MLSGNESEVTGQQQVNIDQEQIKERINEHGSRISGYSHTLSTNEEIFLDLRDRFRRGEEFHSRALSERENLAAS